MHEMPLLRNLI